MAEAICPCNIKALENLRVEDPKVKGVFWFMPDELKVLPNIPVVDVTDRCFKTTMKVVPNMISTLTANLNTSVAPLQLTDLMFSKGAVTTADIIKIGKYQFRIVSIDDEATGEITIAALPGQSVPTTIVSGTTVKVFTNAQGVCSSKTACGEREPQDFEFQTQDIEDCFNECIDLQEMSNNGELKDTVDWNGDNQYAMFQRHLKKLDETVLTSIPSKVNGVKTATGIMYLYNTYGKVQDISGLPLTQLALNKGFSNLKSIPKMPRISFVMMTTNTWYKLQEKIGSNCVGQCIPGQELQALGNSYAEFLNAGTYGRIAVILCDEYAEIEDGMIFPIDANNTRIIKYNGFGRELQEMICDAKNKKRTFQTTLGAMLIDPSRSGYILINMA